MSLARETTGCPFCRIARGEEPAHVVFADEPTLAFLDRRPLFPGHCLLVPRRHVPDLEALPPEIAAALLLNARRLALAMEKALGAEGAFVGLNNKVSQSVPHLHVHVVPRRRKDGLRGFFWPRHVYADEAAAAEVAAALRSAVDAPCS